LDHYLSNHPFEQKIAAFRYYINRLIYSPIHKRVGIWNGQQYSPWQKNNGFPEDIIRKQRTKLLTKKHKQKPTTEGLNQKWVTFTNYGPATRRITNLFKITNKKIAFTITNKIHKQLSKELYSTQNHSGIYELKCNTCSGIYVGQSGRALDIRYKEHIRYVRTNNP